MQKAVVDPNRRIPPSRTGARAHRQSQLTSMALLILVPYAIWVFARLAGQDLATVKQLLGLPFNALAMLLLVIISVWHMWLGMREILEDYVSRGTLRAMLTANSAFCLAVTLAAGGGLLKLWLWS